MHPLPQHYIKGRASEKCVKCVCVWEKFTICSENLSQDFANHVSVLLLLLLLQFFLFFSINQESRMLQPLSLSLSALLLFRSSCRTDKSRLSVLGETMRIAFSIDTDAERELLMETRNTLSLSLFFLTKNHTCMIGKHFMRSNNSLSLLTRLITSLCFHFKLLACNLILCLLLIMRNFTAISAATNNKSLPLSFRAFHFN
jgi:hypothetical protein